MQANFNDAHLKKRQRLMKNILEQLQSIGNELNVIKNERSHSRMVQKKFEHKYIPCPHCNADIIPDTLTIHDASRYIKYDNKHLQCFMCGTLHKIIKNRQIH